jgi:hypothetical protein
VVAHYRFKTFIQGAFKLAEHRIFNVEDGDPPPPTLETQSTAQSLSFRISSLSNNSAMIGVDLENKNIHFAIRASSLTVLSEVVGELQRDITRALERKEATDQAVFLHITTDLLNR